jgi:DNA-binding transcriptional ArsR family regulator
MPSTTLSAIGAAVADGTRAELLDVLMDGRAHTGSELARQVGVAPSTVSEHVSRLRDLGFVDVDAQGRHRYVRLAGNHVAALLESLGSFTGSAPEPSRRRIPAELATARSCYDHLAGEIAVGVYDQLVARGHLAVHDHRPTLTESGATMFDLLGVDVNSLASARRPMVRSCIDWTERRHHLAGSLGAALLDRLLAEKWFSRARSGRALRVTDTGVDGLARHFGVTVR